MTLAIETTNLSKRFGSHAAVHDLNLAVEPGTVFGLIGPNGAGKTTTLRMLLDIIRPTSGRALVLGETPLHGGPALRKRIGFVPGELHLEGRTKGGALLRHFAEISGTVKPGVVDDYAARLNLDLNRPVRTLSKGNKQKIGLVQAFMHEPELLVLDEPTSGLDPLVQREFLTMVDEARSNGQTVLLSSHVLSEIQQSADYVAVLADGKIVAEGDVASLRLGQVRHVRATVDGGATAAELRAHLERIPTVHDAIVRDGTPLRFSATVNGDIDPMIKLLAQFTVLEVTLEEPDLEESVLQLYGNEGTASGAEVRRG